MKEMMNTTDVKCTTFEDIINNSSHRFSNGVVVVNTTPHPINMMDVNGERVEISKGILLNAKAETIGDGLFVTTVFNPSPDGYEIIEQIKNLFNNSDDTLVIAGSIIAAQAYPGEVCGMLPYPGYERTQEKLMRCDKFNIFSAK